MKLLALGVTTCYTGFTTLSPAHGTSAKCHSSGKTQTSSPFISVKETKLRVEVEARVMLHCHLVHVVDIVVPESECGFRRQRSTFDVIFVARLLQENVENNTRASILRS